jgi:hypothetical protein
MKNTRFVIMSLVALVGCGSLQDRQAPPQSPDAESAGLSTQKRSDAGVVGLQGEKDGEFVFSSAEGKEVLKVTDAEDYEIVGDIIKVDLKDGTRKYFNDKGVELASEKEWADTSFSRGVVAFSRADHSFYAISSDKQKIADQKDIRDFATTDNLVAFTTAASSDKAVTTIVNSQGKKLVELENGGYHVHSSAPGWIVYWSQAGQKQMIHASGKVFKVKEKAGEPTVITEPNPMASVVPAVEPSAVPAPMPSAAPSTTPDENS